MYSPFTKITYILTFSPTSSGQFLRAIWNAVSQATVLILPQIKLNSQLSHCAFFFSRWYPDVQNRSHWSFSDWSGGLTWEPSVVVPPITQGTLTHFEYYQPPQFTQEEAVSQGSMPCLRHSAERTPKHLPLMFYCLSLHFQKLRNVQIRGNYPQWRLSFTSSKLAS